MTTHQLARALSNFSRLLRDLPDMPVEEFLYDVRESRHPRQRESKNDAVAVNIATMAALARIGKDNWMEIIRQWDLPIVVPRKDSARNIMGSVLRYLERNPGEIHRLQHVAGRTSKASPELMKALSILMASGKDEEPHP